MLLSDYDCVTVYVVCSLISWCIDFLSDSCITKNETKIGILQYIHHLVSVSNTCIVFLLFFSKSINFAVYSVIITMIIQTGWLINNDSCWYTTMINKMIDPTKPNRKWRSDLGLYIKHYIRGDSWGYSDIFKTDMSIQQIGINVALILFLFKIKINLKY